MLGRLPEAADARPAWATRMSASFSSAIASNRPFAFGSVKQTEAVGSAAATFSRIGAGLVSAALERLDNSGWREATA